MVIDIISYNDQQYMRMTDEQLQEVQSAQRKKNRLTAALAEDLQKEKLNLVENGTFLSGMWPLIQERLQTAYEQEVEAIRNQLLFYLTYSASEEIENAPYTVDYSLSPQERMVIVREYYLTAYTNAAERFAAYKADALATNYLEEYYAPLYDYFLQLSK